MAKERNTDAGKEHREGANVVRLYSESEVTRLVDVNARQLGQWMKRGWIKPARNDGGVLCFDYQQVMGLRRLAQLLKAGATTRRLARSLRQIAIRLPGEGEPLLQLSCLSFSGMILSRTPSGHLMEPHGQLLFDFDETTNEGTVSFLSDSHEADYETSFDGAIALESAGQLLPAAEIYERLLARWPEEAGLWFNYGNVLYALDRASEAEKAFSSAVALDGSSAEAWNNLGAVRIDLGAWDDAERALRRATALAPHNADARENLAELRVLRRRSERKLRSVPPHMHATCPQSSGT